MTATQILLVEDDEDDYILALDYLEELTFVDLKVERATNAKGALSLLENGAFDLCLLDYQLGATNGLEVLKQAQALDISTSIIMLTGQSDDQLDQEALNAGATDYLIKSELNGPRFARAIRYALARREIETERVERLKAEAENRSKSRFLAHLSHELRTPLTAILGYTELLLNSEAGKTAGSELEVIFRNGRHLLDLLNDVLDLSKIAADKLELTFSEVSIASLVVDVYTLMSFSATDKGLKLKLHSDDDIPLTIISDALRLRQVLINLVNNAIKFTDQGSVDIGISMIEERGIEFLKIDVTDTGIGVPQSHIDTIFTPFAQVADVVSKSIGGSGLGLAISSELAKRLGGDLSVKSEVGAGSCFSLRIHPGELKDVQRSRLDFELPSSSSRKIKKLLLHGKVLVVDDLRDIRRLVGHFVEQSGAEVSFASNGAQALALVSQVASEGASFDLILMDIHMPEMGGVEAVTQIRQQNIKFPIVALTAAGMRGSHAKFVEAGFDDMLSKPVDNEKLSSVLSRYLSSSSKRQSPDKLTPRHTKVLVVEDDQDAASALQMLLEGLGAEVKTCASAEDGRLAFKERQWDAILLDKNLPGENGLDLAKDIRASSKQCHIALVSGEDVSDDCPGLSVIDTRLLKPIQLKDLQTLLQNIEKRS